jgi:hypothetical protein
MHLICFLTPCHFLFSFVVIKQVLGGVAWDGPLEPARDARNRLYAPLGLEPPAPSAAGGDGEGGGEGAAAKKAAAAAARGDEHASYQSLLNDAARGLM